MYVPVNQHVVLPNQIPFGIDTPSAINAAYSNAAAYAAAAGYSAAAQNSLAGYAAANQALAGTGIMIQIPY